MIYFKSNIGRYLKTNHNILTIWNLSFEIKFLNKPIENFDSKYAKNL